MSINRDSITEAEKILSKLVSNENLRTEILTLFAASIQKANATNPASWSVTLLPNCVRLNVGSSEAVAIFRGTLLINFEDQLIGDSRRKMLRKLGDFSPGNKVTDITGLEVAVDDAVEAYGELRREHFQLLHENAATKTRWPDTHSPGVMSYLRTLPGLKWLPDPPMEPTIETMVGDELEAMRVEETYIEGNLSTALVNKHERNPALRSAAIRIHGTSCQVCGFDFHAR